MSANGGERRRNNNNNKIDGVCVRAAFTRGPRRDFTAHSFSGERSVRVNRTTSVSAAALPLARSHADVHTYYAITHIRRRVHTCHCRVVEYDHGGVGGGLTSVRVDNNPSESVVLARPRRFFRSFSSFRAPPARCDRRTRGTTPVRAVRRFVFFPNVYSTKTGRTMAAATTTTPSTTGERPDDGNGGGASPPPPERRYRPVVIVHGLMTGDVSTMEHLAARIAEVSRYVTSGLPFYSEIQRRVRRFLSSVRYGRYELLAARPCVYVRRTA